MLLLSDFLQFDFMAEEEMVLFSGLIFSAPIQSRNCVRTSNR